MQAMRKDTKRTHYYWGVAMPLLVTLVKSGTRFAWHSDGWGPLRILASKIIQDYVNCHEELVTKCL